MPHVITEDCTQCASCISVCPSEAISEGDPIFKIDPERCGDCGTCVEHCPTESILPGSDSD